MKQPLHQVLLVNRLSCYNSVLALYAPLRMFKKEKQNVVLRDCYWRNQFCSVGEMDQKFPSSNVGM